MSAPRVKPDERERMQHIAARVADIVDNTVVTFTVIADQAGIELRRLNAMARGARPVTRPVARRLEEWLRQYDLTFPEGAPAKPELVVRFDPAALGIDVDALRAGHGEIDPQELATMLIGAARAAGVAPTATGIAEACDIDQADAASILRVCAVDAAVARKALHWALQG